MAAPFPGRLPAEGWRARPAEFTVTRQERARAAVEAAIDDALAQRLGLADLAGLARGAEEQSRPRVPRGQPLQAQARAAGRARSTPRPSTCPARMVEAEFHTIWHEVERERAAGDLSPEDAAKSEEELRAEYRAHRRAPRAPGPGARRDRPPRTGRGQRPGSRRGHARPGDAVWRTRRRKCSTPCARTPMRRRASARRSMRRRSST